MIYLYWLHCKLKVILFFRRLVWGWDGNDSKHWKRVILSTSSMLGPSSGPWKPTGIPPGEATCAGEPSRAVSALRCTTHCVIESEFYMIGLKKDKKQRIQIVRKKHLLCNGLNPCFLYIPLPNLPTKRHRTIWWFRWQHRIYLRVSRLWASLRRLHT